MIKRRSFQINRLLPAITRFLELFVCYRSKSGGNFNNNHVIKEKSTILITVDTIVYQVNGQLDCQR